MNVYCKIDTPDSKRNGKSILKKRICLTRYDHELFNNGYILENNTSKEILDATIEIEDKTRNSSFQENNNDQIFWEKYNKDKKIVDLSSLPP